MTRVGTIDTKTRTTLLSPDDLRGLARRVRSALVAVAVRLPITSRVITRVRRRRSLAAAVVSSQRAAAVAQAEVARAQALVREQARLWATSLSDGASAARGPFEALMRDGRFSYRLFDDRRSELTGGANLLGLGEKSIARLRAEAGPVRFGPRTRGPNPDRRVAFATVCTDKFCPGLEALICSLLEIYPDLTSDFWVFHDGGLSMFSQQRLTDLYPSFRFADRDSEKYRIAAAGDSPNQQRIGAIGYLTIEALLLDQYQRVVLLDSDLLVLDDISLLWTPMDGEDARVIPDAGALPLLARSELTGEVVFNSGVISLPAVRLGRESFAEALDLLPAMPGVTCPVLRDFADQKFWNVYLARFELSYLPANYNVNKQLIDGFLPENRADAAILHFTGTKPWFTFASRELVTLEERRRSQRAHVQYPYTFPRWHDVYRRFVGAHRRADFQTLMGDALADYRDSRQGSAAVLIGNGPSLRRTNLDALGARVRIGFNWIVNHERFDDIQLDHLMVMSHMFFGGWHTAEPAFPPGYLEALGRHQHRPTVWFPFYFRPLIEATPELGAYEVRYLLFEKPFKEFVDDLGYLKTDLFDFLSDARTGVLTAGLPLALHLGCSDVVLVGCDASYGATGGGDYFYDASRHTSKSTTTSSLHAAWAEGGAAHACYGAALREAERRGVSFTDATLGGLLTAIPKIEVPGLALSS